MKHRDNRVGFKCYTFQLVKLDGFQTMPSVAAFTQYSTVLPGLHIPTPSAPHVGCTAVILRLFSSISSGCCVRPGKRDKTAEELRRRDRPSDRREGRDVDTRGCSSAPGLTGPSLTLVLVSVHRQHKKRHIIINITAQHSTNSEAEHHILLSQRDSF